MMRFNGGPLLTEMFANMDKIIVRFIEKKFLRLQK